MPRILFFIGWSGAAQRAFERLFSTVTKVCYIT